MARIRYLKPDFFLDFELAKLPPLVRLFYQGLWCHADRAGRGVYEPQKLKVQIIPWEEITAEKCFELLDPKWVVRYKDKNGQELYQILNFEKHQTPHASEKESVLQPLPLNNVKKRRVTAKTVFNGDFNGEGNGEEKDNLTTVSPKGEKVEIPKEPEPYKAETSLQKCICAWKEILGFEFDDRGWDSLNFKRTAKSVSKLLEFFNDDRGRVIDCMNAVSKMLQKKNLDYTIETVVKYAAEWNLANPKIEKPKFEAVGVN